MKESLRKRVLSFGLDRITTNCGQPGVKVEQIGLDFARIYFKTDRCGGCSQTVNGSKQWIGAGSRADDCPYWNLNVPKPYGALNIDGKEVEIYKVNEKLRNWLISTFIRF